MSRPGKSGRRSTVESHPQRAEIEFQIANKVRIAKIAENFRLHDDALYRHRQKMSPQLIAALRYRIPETHIDLQALKESESQTLMHQLLAIDGHLSHALSLFLENGDALGIVRVSREFQQNIRLKAELLGDLTLGDTHQHLTVNLWHTPEAIRAMQSLMTALAPFPEARKAVAAQMRSIEVPTFDVPVKELAHAGA